MSSYSYYEHKRTESVNLPYFFRCEQCMQDSGFLTATVTGWATKDTIFKEISQKQDEKVRQKAHKHLVKLLKSIQKDFVEKQRVDTVFGDECPHCHKHQSWGISGMKREMFTMPAAFLIFGAFLSAVYLKFEEDKAVALIFMAICVLGAIISLIWNIIKIKQKMEGMDPNRPQSLPVIAWEAVQYLLDEA